MVSVKSFSRRMTYIVIVIARRAIRIIGICIVVGFGLTSTACVQPWKAMDDATPWAAGGIPARAIGRVVEKPFFVVAAPDRTMDVRWEDARGVKHRPRDIVEHAQSYLDASGMSQNWPLAGIYIGGSRGGVEQRIAPFDFTIVSIDPVVVLMTPHELGPDIEGTRREIVGELADRHQLRGRWLANPFRYGSRMPYDEHVLWFSPDLKHGPSELPMTNAVSEVLLLPHGRLRLMRKGQWWMIVRE